MIRFETREYFNSHLKEPKGNGLWMFGYGLDSRYSLQVSGTYTEAKKKVKQHFKERGLNDVIVKVLP